MKNILCLLLTFFLFSCKAIDGLVDMRSTLERNDNAQQILDQLNDSELKKGKIFVLSWHREHLLAQIRVNSEVIDIKREEIQSFELKEGNNSLYTHLVSFGTEVGNCNKEPYVFNTNDFEDDETHYFILIEAPGPIFTCFRDVHVTEEAFHYKKENPRSRWKEGWTINY